MLTPPHRAHATKRLRQLARAVPARKICIGLVNLYGFDNDNLYGLLIAICEGSEESKGNTIWCNVLYCTVLYYTLLLRSWEKAVS